MIEEMNHDAAQMPQTNLPLENVITADTVSRGTEGQFWTQMLHGAVKVTAEDRTTVEEKALHAEMLNKLYAGELEPDQAPPAPPERLCGFAGFTRPGIAELTEEALNSIDRAAPGAGFVAKPVLTTFAPLSSLGMDLGSLSEPAVQGLDDDAGMQGGSTAVEGHEEAARRTVKARVVEEVERRSQEVHCVAISVASTVPSSPPAYIYPRLCP